MVSETGRGSLRCFEENGEFQVCLWTRAPSAAASRMMFRAMCLKPLMWMVMPVTPSAVAFSRRSPTGSPWTRSFSSPVGRKQARQARQARRKDSVSSFKHEFVACMSPCDRGVLVCDTLSSLSSAPVIHEDMNSCVFLHAWDLHFNSYGVVHVNSAQEFIQFAWSWWGNKATEYEYSVHG